MCEPWVREHQQVKTHYSIMVKGNASRHEGEVWSTQTSGTCEGCDIVQSDHAPQAGVAQGIFHGDLIRRRDGHQVELEEELEEEVERRVRRDHSSNKTQVRMHG